MLVESDGSTARLIAANARDLRLRADVRAARAETVAANPGRRFDLVFLDPPYRQHLADRVLPLLESGGLLNPGALVIVEEHALAELPEQIGALTLTDRRRYGETGLWIFRHQPAGN